MSDVIPKATGIPAGLSEDDIKVMAGTRDEETPEDWEQEEYDRVMNAFYSFVDGEKTDRSVLNSMNQSGVPAAESVGRVAAQIGWALNDAAKGRGEEISPDVMYAAGQEMVESLMDKGAALGVFGEMDPESPQYQETLDLAFLEATKNYGEQLLQSPDYPRIKQSAENHYLHQVATEADQGGQTSEVMPT